MLLALLGLTACSDYEFDRQTDLGNTEDPGSLTGRICNEDLGMWMSGVLVYTHIYEWDTLIDTIMDTTI